MGTFSLSLTLPYFALRRYQRGIQHCLKLPIPSREAAGSVSFEWLYECQASVTVTGTDAYNWTAFQVIDSPNAADDRQTTALSDPLGKRASGTGSSVYSDPRIYFLEVLKWRISDILKEWEAVIGTVERGVAQ